MNFPDVTVSPEKLYRMCYASVQSGLLMTAVRLRIFDHLSDSARSGEVARAIDGHKKNTRLFLNALAACGLLAKKKGYYKNTPLAQSFLTSGTQTDLGPGFIQQGELFGLMPKGLDDLVLNGPPSGSAKESSGTDEKWGRQAAWMANNQRAGIVQQMADMVADLPEFPSFKLMLDIGGGPGLFCLAMVKKHADMQGVVFDQKPVVKVAEQFINEYGLKKRVRVLGGDYNTDSIGSGYDFIWASSSLNFARNNMDRVMAKIHAALNPGGVFASLAEGLTHERTQPDFYILCTLVWAMQNPFAPFEQGQIADAMLTVGFKSVRSGTVKTGWGPMDLDIARK